ncbi:MAG: hypothetical protein EHM42_03735, partial [Planctomycetaceae bacterium]
MPTLEVRRRTGTTETIALDRRSPLTIGASAAADIRVDAEGVAPIECRLNWSGSGFVVAAVNPDGVSLNGSSVWNEALADADVLRVGDVDVVFRETAATERKPVEPESDEPRFADDSIEDLKTYSPKSPPVPPPQAAPPVSPRKRETDRTSKSTAPVRPEKPSKPVAADRESRPRESATRPSPPEKPAVSPRPARSGPAPAEKDSGEYGVTAPPAPPPESAAISAVLENESLAQERPPAMLTRGGSDQPPRPAGPTLGEQIRTVLRPPPRRPGEQELHRSPLVVGLTIGSLVLLLTAGTLWFVLGREFMQRKYDAARQQFESGQYAQAIEGFDKFVAEYPRHELAKQARVDSARARVEQSLSGAIPDWDAGLKTLNEFISQYRDSDDFQPADS